MSKIFFIRCRPLVAPSFDKYPPEVFALLTVCIAASTPGVSMWIDLLLKG